MTDLSEFYALSKPRKPPCKVGLVLEQLAGETEEQVEAALAKESHRITNAAVIEWLEGHKHKDLAASLTISALTTHRKGKCSCRK